MPTLPIIREKVIRLANGAIYTDENRFDDLYIESLIHSARASVLRDDYRKNRRWSPQAVQQFFPEYEEDFQDSVCYSRFTIPTSFIQGTSACDGLIYFGSGGEQILSAENFRRIKNRSELTDFCKNQYTTPANGRFTAILIEGLVVTIVGKNSMTKYPMVAGVFEDPTAIDTYNVNSDLYPLPDDLELALFDVINKGTLLQTMGRPADTVSDSKDTLSK